MMILQKMLTKDLRSLHCKHCADFSSFKENYVMIEKVQFCADSLEHAYKSRKVSHLDRHSNVFISLA